VCMQVIQCVLEDFDVVYAPSVCSYGSCPATLEHCPGTSVRVFVTFLGKEALERMHQTEGTYTYLRLSQLRLHMGVPLHDFTWVSEGGLQDQHVNMCGESAIPGG
jgi:hypothetical protein